MLYSQALCGGRIVICEEVQSSSNLPWRTEYLGVGEMGENRFMDARGPNKYITDKIHYCTYRINM